MTSKLSEAKDQGLIMQVVQKFDMHMKSFDMDQNTQLRWVWELIQNAKDAPNDFGISKIKQELTDTQFISKHNANAFTIKQIHSVIAQYSTKVQQNDKERKTTGKYGTGFITTFLIGKVVNIEGYIRIEVDDQQDEKRQKVKIQSTMPLQNTKSNSKVGKQSKNNKVEASGKMEQQKKNIFYYKKFELPLDRHYEQRDKELKKKVQKGDHLLQRAVFDGQEEREKLLEIPVSELNKHKHKFQHHFSYVEKRNVDSYNTSFAYTIQEAQKVPMIEKAMINVKRLMPYAILFNERLQFYEFIDSRKTKKQNLSFSIQKLQLKELKNAKNLQNLYLFTYLFKSEYNIKTKKFNRQQKRYMVAYASDGKRIYAAIPVSNFCDKWQVESIGADHCQLYKDFPLIGSIGIGWNAAINSDNFYPNEKRSELMLTHIDKLGEKKVEANRKQLEICFEGIKQLYLFLALEFCSRGLSNLLIFNEENGFTRQFPVLKRLLKNYIHQIQTAKFISTSQQNKANCSLKELIFIELAQKDVTVHKKTETQASLSLKISETFRIFHDERCVVSSQSYEDFYSKLHKGRSNESTYLHLHKMVKILTISDCLKQMQKNKYAWFKRRFLTNSIHQLSQIYQLLVENNLEFADYAIILNENLEFKSIKKNNLMIKKIQPIVEEIFLFLDIDLKKFLIKQELSAVFYSFENAKFLDDKAASRLISQTFDETFKSLTKELATCPDMQLRHQQTLQSLFSLLLTLDQSSQKNIEEQKQKKPKKTIKNPEDKAKKVLILDFEKIKRFTLFSDVEIFKVFSDIKKLAELNKHIREKLLTLFVRQFVIYFDGLQRKYQTSFSKFCEQKLQVTNEDEGAAFFSQLFSDSLFGEPLSILSFKLTLGNTFSEKHMIYCLAQNVAYPNEQDVEIYDILKEQMPQPGFGGKKIKDLKQRLIMPVYPKSIQISRTNYANLFRDVKREYDQLNEIKKYKVLTYLKSINDEFTKSTSVNPTIAEKYNAWKDLINQRVIKMFQLKNRLKTFDEEPVKQFLYDLFDNEHELKKLSQIYGKRNRSKDSISESFVQVQSQPNKKIKKQ